jgi:hypothetical protein
VNGRIPKEKKGLTLRVRGRKRGGKAERGRELAADESRRYMGEVARKLLVQSGMEHGDQEMGKMSGAVVHLKPANDTMVGEILGNASFRNAEMLSELRLDGLTVAGRTTKQLADGDTQSLTGFDVVIRGEIVVGENLDAGACGSMSSIVELSGAAREQAAEIHFELREAGR